MAVSLSGAFRRIGRLQPRARLESAMRSRRLAAWVPPLRNLNTQVVSDGDLTLRRAREIVLSNAIAANACEAFVANAIGAGIKPSSLTEDAEAKRAIQKLWLAWTDEADADGLTDFYGLQALVAREVFVAGECFVRLRARRPEDGLVVPLQLQLLQAEMLPLDKSGVAPNGNAIRCGIEFDRIGRRVAYWFLRKHPGDRTEAMPAYDPFVRVPAAEVLHVRRPLEAGQLRGLPHITPALVRLHQIDQYMDAQVERQKTAALFVGFIVKNLPDDALLNEVEGEDGDGIARAPLQPGTMQVLLPGEDVRFSTPTGVGSDFEPFVYRVSLELAAAMGIPYATVTGDLRQASYGSQRAGLVEFRRRMEQLQHAVFVYQLCRPVWQRWLADAVLAGALTLPGFGRAPRAWWPAKWIPPRWEWIDPLKDRQAEKLAVDAGFKARSDVVEAEGYDAEEVDERIAADRAREAELGLSFAAGAGETQGARETPEQPDQPASDQPE
ncbi:MAG: phage portal protein [Rhodospirillales bacterium]|nr:phage portal protein [Rhodospirillales bacterium]